MHLRNIIISAVLLGLVFGGALLAQTYTQRVCDQTASVLEQASQLASDGDLTGSTRQIAEAIEQFSANAGIFSLIHHHSYAENIMIYLQRAKVYAEAGFLPELESELRAAVVALEALGTRDALLADNIF